MNPARVALVVSLAVPIWAGPVAAQAPPKRYAVLIGVNDYDHPKLPGLRFSVNDATELAAVLKPAGYDVTLLSDESGQKPTKANIDAALKATLSRCQRGDTVVVAFSGHGLQFQGTKDAYFCPSDARPSVNGKDSLISLSKLYADLEDSFAGVKVLLVDACRNDPGPDRDEETGFRGVDADSAPNPPRGVAAFFSCSAGERAVEHGSLKHGVFFHYVLDGLRGKAKNARGVVTFNSLTDYVAASVSDEVPRLTKGQAKQSPNQKADLSGASPVLMVSLAVPADPGRAALERGLALYYGREVKQDIVAAADHFRTAAEAGNAEGMFYLGRVYSLRDLPEARDWIEKADRAGHRLALGQLSYFYLNGVGVGRDEPRADRLDRQAIGSVRNAADAGEPVAMSMLARMYLAGWGGLVKDEAEAAKWYTKAAAAGEPAAMTNLGRLFVQGQGGMTKDDITAVRWFRKAAAGGYSPALIELGYMYLTGRGGLTKDEVEAVECFKKAAAAGDPTGLKSLGDMYAEGRGGLTKDDAEAVRSYRAAATAGECCAMTNLGAMYLAGRSVAKDEAEAVRWYRKASEAGCVTAMVGLGRMYSGGQNGLAKDDAEALRWCKKAADGGSAEGMRLLGVMYLDGYGGLPKDESEAVRWIRKAADAGSTAGMYDLARIYDNGWAGLGKNEREAFQWYQKAAEAGHAKAMNNVGVMYEQGTGVTRNRDEAAQWYRKAVAAGNQNAADNLKRLGGGP